MKFNQTIRRINNMKKTIAVLPGDGIGPEIINQAVKVINAIAEVFGHDIEYKYASIGACAIDECGESYPLSTHKVCEESDAILFGAIGDPKYDNNPTAVIRPEQGLLKMRKELGLFANIRPIHIYPSLISSSPLKESIVKDADFIVIRELTGGMYFGEPRGRSENGDKAFDSCVYSREEITRITKKGFEYARRRRKKLTMVDKANVLATSRLWREVVTEIHKKQYSDIELEFMYVDNAAMKIVSNPSCFDIILTENMFGDILSDIAGVINGSIGLIPSASLGEMHSLFEPIHGSFPQAEGKNIANPIATILSAAMMFEDAFQANKEGKMIRQGCEQAINDGICTEDIVAGSKYGTTNVGDYIANYIKQTNNK